jgi:multiple sugar transport system substrate-binding protein
VKVVKLRIWLAALITVALAVAGCSSGGGDKGDKGTGKEPIRVWSLEREPDRLEATKAIVAKFTQATGIKVNLSGIDEDQLPKLVTSASAADKLPDVMQLPVALAHSYADQRIIDADAANEAVDTIGRDTFSPRALKLLDFKGKSAAVPSDGWGQLLIYRKDLFRAAGLDAPDTFDKIQTAATKLNKPDMAGIVLATTPGDEFTQQSFEGFALADGCQLADSQGKVTLDTPNCVDAIRFYTNLAKQYSVKGNQDVDSTRATYFAGKAAMVVWSPFILDEMAGLRKDALPSCAECRKDPAFLAKNSGLVTSIQGTQGQTAEYGELSTWAISDTAHKTSAQRFVEYMLNDGYVDWLALSPEGKFPLRPGTSSNPNQFVDAWAKLKTGVDEKQPLSSLYPAEELNALKQGSDSFQRWGFEQGQAVLAGAVHGEQPVTKVLSQVINGGMSPENAARNAQREVESLQESIK